MSPRNLALSAAVLSASAVAVLASAAFPALAQSSRVDPPRAEPAVDRQVERRVFIGRSPSEGMTERLRAALQLRPDQEAALRAYFAAARPDQPGRELAGLDRLAPLGGDRPPTPERLAQLEERLNRQQAQTRTLIDATRRFYDQLDAGQKRAFDAMPMVIVGVNVGPMLVPIADFPDPADLRELRELRRFRGEPPGAPEPPRPPRPPQPPL